MQENSVEVECPEEGDRNCNGAVTQGNDPGSVAESTNGNSTTQANDQGQTAGGG